MFKVKANRLFKLKPAGTVFKAGDEMELSENEVNAVKKQLGEEFIEVIEKVQPEQIDFNDMNVPPLKKWLKENNVEFDEKANKDVLVELAENKAKEQEENTKE